MDIAIVGSQSQGHVTVTWHGVAMKMRRGYGTQSCAPLGSSQKIIHVKVYATTAADISLPSVSRVMLHAMARAAVAQVFADHGAPPHVLPRDTADLDPDMFRVGCRNAPAELALAIDPRDGLDQLTDAVDAES